MKLFDYMKKHKAASLAFALIFSGLGVFALVNTFAGTGLGPAYDWKKGTILYDYKPMNSMPEGWVYVDYYTTNVEPDDFTTTGFWTPAGTPVIGSREIIPGDKGDDVTALQTSLNLVRTDDKNDPYYFDELKVSGKYDDKTQNAVKLLEKYYGLSIDGVCDLDFQASLYSQITTPEI